MSFEERKINTNKLQYIELNVQFYLNHSVDERERGGKREREREREWERVCADVLKHHKKESIVFELSIVESHWVWSLRKDSVCDVDLLPATWRYSIQRDVRISFPFSPHRFSFTILILFHRWDISFIIYYQISTFQNYSLVSKSNANSVYCVKWLIAVDRPKRNDVKVIFRHVSEERLRLKLLSKQGWQNICLQPLGRMWPSETINLSLGGLL